MPVFLQKIAIDSQLIVSEIITLSKSIIQIRFQLDKKAILAVEALGLGPHLKLIFPEPGQQSIVFPDLNEAGKIIWPEGEKLAIRTYSLRAYDAASHTLTIEFAIHAEGIGSKWAQYAKPGDVIGALGIGAKCEYQQQYLVLVGDITAKPAISYILEHLPADAKGHAFIEVPDHSDMITIRKPQGVTLSWHIQQHPSLFPEMLIKSLNLPDEGNILIWGGMEGSLAQHVRHCLVDQFNVNKSDIQLLNYWRIGFAEGEFRRREG
ncbi:siderophore-interacting protein [Utexia brackfieldae]|uniref:siderophore-interacting protein n=1 Tax=Utexia brackfieldae TaxID=3074108 RepID=UPI00370DA1AD